MNNAEPINTQEPYAATIVDFTQGSLKDTKQTLDVAIAGDGMFVIEFTENIFKTKHAASTRL